MFNTTLCYIEKNDSYLMIHRIKKKNDCNHDKWIGVGGKFEEGESPEDCVAREVLEETGLVLNKAEYRGIVTFVSRENNAVYYELMHLFWSNDFSVAKTGDKLSDSNITDDNQIITAATLANEANYSDDFILPDCDEGILEWIPKNKMNDIPHWKGDEIFLSLLDKKVPFFSLKLVYEDGVLIKSILNGVEL